METIKLQKHVGSDGILKLEFPVGIKDANLEIVVIVHPLEKEVVDELGWPIGFFERTYGALADDPIERGEQGEYEVRDEIS